MTKHNEGWFLKQESRLREPFKNTKLYNFIPNIIFIVLYIATKDYYHGWQALAFSILDVSIFLRVELTWHFALEFLIWLIVFAVQLLALFFMVKSIVNLIRCKYYVNVSQAQADDYLGSARAVTFTGAPGCGKTFSAGANFAIVLAEQRWAKLQSDYILARSMVPHWMRACDVDKLKAFRALEMAYAFYAQNEDFFIPCLISSIPLQDLYGRFSYQLTPDVYLQAVRVPEYTVIFNDESGKDQGAKYSKTTEDVVMEFWRLNRHYGDFILLNTEQSTDGNGKHIRRVTDYNIMLKRQMWLMRPHFALKLLGFAKKRYFKGLAKRKFGLKKARELGESLFYAEKILKTIGFRRIPYRFGASENNVVDLEQGEYIFPARGMADYDDRAYRGLYKAKDKQIDLKPWMALVIEENGARAELLHAKREKLRKNSEK